MCTLYVYTFSTIYYLFTCVNCILGWLFSSSEYISITPSDLPSSISGTPVAVTSWTPILAIPGERERGRGREGEGGREGRREGRGEGLEGE